MKRRLQKLHLTYLASLALFAMTLVLVASAPLSLAKSDLTSVSAGATPVCDDIETGPQSDASPDIVFAEPLQFASLAASLPPPMSPAHAASLPAYLKYAAMLL